MSSKSQITPLHDRVDEPVTVKKGDTVLYGKYSGTEVRIDGQDLLIVREGDILAIV